MANNFYLLQHKNIPEYTKIGITKDMVKRINSLNTSSPTGIIVLYQKETDRAKDIEKYLHKKYAHKNSNLEWFQLTNSDIMDIIDWSENLLN